MIALIVYFCATSFGHHDCRRAVIPMPDWQTCIAEAREARRQGANSAQCVRQ